MLQIQNLCKNFGAVQATDDVSLDVSEGTIHALIGPNGAGKTTLIAQLSGYLEPDSGSITFNGHDLLSFPADRRPHLGLVRSFQITSVFPQLSVLDNVCMVLQSFAGQARSLWRPAYADRDEREKASNILDRVGLLELAHMQTSALAHGQKRQVEIAMALAAQPKLLLLDEPMAGMGVEESRSLTALLDSLRGEVTMLLVEHDMDVVFGLADTVSVLVYGRVTATGRPNAIKTNPAVQQAYLGDA